jgi:hypothetical protein
MQHFKYILQQIGLFVKVGKGYNADRTILGRIGRCAAVACQSAAREGGRILRNGQGACAALTQSKLPKARNWWRQSRSGM